MVREFCRDVRKYLHPIFIQILDESQFRVLAKMFEQLHGLPYIIGQIDGLHIHVQVPVIGGEGYNILNHFI
jgi:hypothetical protein